MRRLFLAVAAIAACPAADLLLTTNPTDNDPPGRAAYRTAMAAVATAGGDAEARFRATIARTDALSRIFPSTYAVYGITAEAGAEIDRDSIDATVLTTSYEAPSFDIRELSIGKGTDKKATGVFGAFIHVTYTCTYSWRTRAGGTVTAHTSAAPESLETHHVLYPAAAVTEAFARFKPGAQVFINGDLYTPPK